MVSTSLAVDEKSHLESFLLVFLKLEAVITLNDLRHQARLWRIRDRLYVLRGAGGGVAGGAGHVFSLLREQQVREMRQEVLSIYGALRAVPDISLLIPF
jgi:hypothetical protein